MKTRASRILEAAALAALVLGARPAAADSYLVTDLGSFGGPISEPSAIDELGDVVGDAATSTGAIHPFLYSDGQLVDLGTLPGKVHGRATGVNNVGEIVGDSDPANVDFAPAPFLFSDGHLARLVVSGSSVSVEPSAIDDAGDVVGSLIVPSGQQHGFLLQNQTIIVLPTLGGPTSSALAIGGAGDVVGVADTATGRSHAFLYRHGTLTDLGTLVGPNGSSAARAVNSKGQIVGDSSQIFGTDQAFLYSGGVMTDVGALPGAVNSVALGINEGGQIVGESDAFQDTRRHGFIAKNGTITDLNDAIPQNGVFIQRAVAINAAGQIAAFGPVGSVSTPHALLLSPAQLNRFAYAFAGSPTAPIYTPANAYNASGGAISILREATGRYDVFFDALPGGVAGLASAVAVTAVGSSTATCSVAGFGATMTGTTVTVSCFDQVSRALVDSAYTILVMGDRSLDGPSAFAMTGGIAPVGAPSPATSWTTGDQPISAVRRAGGGDYVVGLGTGSNSLNARLVSSTGAPGSRCDDVQPTSSGLEVRCYDAAGSGSDQTFSVLQVGSGRIGRRFGFAIANQATTPSYVPLPATAFSSSGGVISASRSSTGRYQIDFAGLQTLAGHTEQVQVTAMGAVLRTCNVVGWGNSSDGLQIAVECRDAAGNLADTRYQVLLIE